MNDIDIILEYVHLEDGTLAQVGREGTNDELNARIVQRELNLLIGMG